MRHSIIGLSIINALNCIISQSWIILLLLQIRMAQEVYFNTLLILLELVPLHVICRIVSRYCLKQVDIFGGAFLLHWLF